jgi:hypothetical protein
MLDNPRDAERMAAAARSQVEEHFEPGRLGEELADAYETALRFGEQRERAHR